MATSEMNPGQTITACGQLRNITVQMKKYGSPVFNIRAKIYLDVPIDFETGFPLDNYLGESTNVISAASLTGTFTNQSFAFSALEITGKWTVVFEYEDVTNHDLFNFVNLAIGMGEGDTDLYTGGEFVYYSYDSDMWWLFPYGDMVFTCGYCHEDCPTTTTTTRGLEPR